VLHVRQLATRIDQNAIAKLTALIRISVNVNADAIKRLLDYGIIVTPSPTVSGA